MLGILRRNPKKKAGPCRVRPILRQAAHATARTSIKRLQSCVA
jgi:hypothetical protein